MGRYLGSWAIDNVVYVHKQLSAVTTGAAADGDSVPTWRVYEDNTATPVTTGSFATLNSQTGFYVAAITLAAAIGYEKGRSYALRTACTVAGIIGADVDSFQIEAEVDANTVSPTLVVTVNGASQTAIVNAITAGSIGAVTLGSTSNAAIAAAVTAGSIGPVTLGATSQAAVVDLVWAETA